MAKRKRSYASEKMYKGALLPLGRGCPCPKRGGPKEVDWGTCNGCRYYFNLARLGYIDCTHMHSGKVGAKWMGNAITAWEKAQGKPEKPKRVKPPKEKPVEAPAEPPTGQIALF